MKYAFVTCCPGSGSTLFSALLNLHPEVLSLSEVGLAWPAGMRQPLLRAIDGGEVFERNFWLRDASALERDRFRSLAEGGSGSFDLADALVNMSSWGDNDPGPPGRWPKLFVEKDPVQAHRISEVAAETRYRPRANAPFAVDQWMMFYLSRSPYATVNSLLRKHAAHGYRIGVQWGPTDPLAGSAITDETPIVERAVRMWIECEKAVALAVAAGHHVVALSYEALVEDPVHFLTAFFAKAGVPWSTERIKQALPAGFVRRDRSSAWEEELNESVADRIALAEDELEDWTKRICGTGMALNRWSSSELQEFAL